MGMTEVLSHLPVQATNIVFHRAMLTTMMICISIACLVWGKVSSPVQGDGGDGRAGVDGVQEKVQGDAAGTASVEDRSTAGQSTASISKAYKGKSHNKKRACPLCDFWRTSRASLGFCPPR